MKFSEQKTATVLAALRLWQDTNPVSDKYQGYFEEVEPLNDEEIDALCEEINFDTTDATHTALVEVLEQAVARIELANNEGTPILSAWLPDARAALATAKEEHEFVQQIADNEAHCTCNDESWFGEPHTVTCVYAQAFEIVNGYRPEGKP